MKIPVRRYALTALGEQELSENEYVTYFGHSIKYGLNVWDMNRMLEAYPHKLYRDKIWAHLNQQVQESVQTLQRDRDLYSFYCREVSANYEMCNFLLEEKKSPLDALRLWSVGFHYDILIKSAFEFKLLLDTRKFNDGPTMKRMRGPNTGESVLVEDNSPPQFRDSLFLEYKLGTVKDIQEQLGFTDEEFFQQLVQFFKECQAIDYEHLNRNITKLNLSFEDMAGLVVSEASENKNVTDKIYKNIEAQIKKDKTPVFKSVLTPEQRKHANIRLIQ